MEFKDFVEKACTTRIKLLHEIIDHHEFQLDSQQLPIDQAGYFVGAINSMKHEVIFLQSLVEVKLELLDETGESIEKIKLH